MILAPIAYREKTTRFSHGTEICSLREEVRLTLTCKPIKHHRGAAVEGKPVVPVWAIRQVCLPGHHQPGNLSNVIA
eukprot:942145-Pyramimonas_sp.AAC.1